MDIAPSCDRSPPARSHEPSALRRGVGVCGALRLVRGHAARRRLPTRASGEPPVPIRSPRSAAAPASGSPRSSRSAMPSRSRSASSTCRPRATSRARATARPATRSPGRSTRARTVIDALAAGDRAQAAEHRFKIGHPVADAGDDQSAGPDHAARGELPARQLHGALPRRDVRVHPGPDGFRAHPPEQFIDLYRAEDGWRSNALDVLRRLERPNAVTASGLSRGRSAAPGPLRDRPRDRPRRLLGRLPRARPRRSTATSRSSCSSRRPPRPRLRASGCGARSRRSAASPTRTSSRSSISSKTGRGASSSWSTSAAPTCRCGCASAGRSTRTRPSGSGATSPARFAAAHRRGILHRDVKPQNVLLDPDGRARLTDFGSAKLDGQLGVTGSGTLAGTLAYTAPEVLAGRRGDARADVYALGLTLYYALTGELPDAPSPHLPPTPCPPGFRPRRVGARRPGLARRRGRPCHGGRRRRPVPHRRGARRGAGPAAARPTRSRPAPAPPACSAAAPIRSRSASARRAAARPTPPTPSSSSADRAGGAGAARGRDRLELVLPDVGGDAAARGREGRAAALPGVARGRAPAGGGDGAPRAGARPVPALGAWGAVPPKAWMLAGAAVTAGAVAGSLAMPMLLWTSPAGGIAASCSAPGATRARRW